MITHHDWPFGDAINQMQRLADELAANLDHINKQLDEAARRTEEAAIRTKAAWEILGTELPKRGWYLSGNEPIDLVAQLAHKAKALDSAAVDQLLLNYIATNHLKNDLFQQWLTQHNVPNYCIGRIRVFLDHRDEGNHEVATIVGMTVIDELARYLYGGRDFTTKRGRQPRPQLACRTTKSASELKDFARAFVGFFGELQHDVDPSRLMDEDYLNRHAVLHGRMQRPYGPKDSAKLFMALMFLVFGLDYAPS
jgi:hypothetical protein